MKKILCLMTFLCLCAGVFAAPKGEKKFGYNGFIGGMMVHSGWLSAGDVTYNMLDGSDPVTLTTQGVPFGIGGTAKFAFGQYFRFGGEGHVTNLTYGKTKSHAILGWGGLVFDGVYNFWKCRGFIGALIGGGGQRNIAIIDADASDFVIERAISHRNVPFMAVSPYLGFDIPLGRITLVVKADYMLKLTRTPQDFITGPRLYFGFMFGHQG